MGPRCSGEAGHGRAAVTLTRSRGGTVLVGLPDHLGLQTLNVFFPPRPG